MAWKNYINRPRPLVGHNQFCVLKFPALSVQPSFSPVHRKFAIWKSNFWSKNILFLRSPLRYLKLSVDQTLYFIFVDPINGLFFRPKFRGISPQFIWPYLYTFTSLHEIGSWSSHRSHQASRKGGLPRLRRVASGRGCLIFRGNLRVFRFGFSQGLNALPNDDQRGRYITIIIPWLFHHPGDITLLEGDMK